MAHSKSTSSVNTMAPVKKTAPPSAPAPPAPVKTTKKTTPPAKVEVVVPEVVVPTQAVAPKVSADTILASLQESLKALSADVSKRLRDIHHDALTATKALKREARESKHRKKVDPATLSPEDRAKWEEKRKNNAFLRPRVLSDELSAFLGLPANSQRSQTEVTKAVSAYVKEHNCFDASNKRRILPDAKLARLLRAKDGDEITYLTLQSYLKVHYTKPA